MYAHNTNVQMSDASRTRITEHSADVTRLHEEIDAFYLGIHRDGKEANRRKDVIVRIGDLITSEYPDVTVECVGSTATGLFLTSSCIDIAVLPRTRGIGIFIREVWLEECRQRFASAYAHTVKRPQIVTVARMPLLLVEDISTGIKCYISFDRARINCHEVRISQWIASGIILYPALPKIIVFVKETLRRQSLSSIHCGGISGYALTLMVISYFQLTYPGSDNLGKLLLGFLNMFGNKFDHRSLAIVIADGGSIISKDEMQTRIRDNPVSSHLSIQDPVDPQKDAALHSQQGMIRVLRLFRNAGVILDAAMTTGTLPGETYTFMDAIEFREPVKMKPDTFSLLELAQQLVDKSKH